ncbi:MAG TPA: hypothetical protein VMZ28_02550 [Kofleriaceae bacterium]|nr:hypothetical protein [Kofleriaceae bacterium]
MAAALLVGCSWVYDADDLRGRGDGAPGSGPDADPDALHVFEVRPGGFLEEDLLEGEGSSAIDGDAAEGVRAIPIVLDGQNMTDDTTITVDGAGFEDVAVDATVSADGHLAAFELRVPLGLDEEGSLRIELHKPETDETFTPRLVVVHDLTALERDGGQIDTDDVEPYYTNVVLSGVVTATGDAPLRIYATAGIEIDGTLRADGAEQEAGPGGCAGGDAGTAALCGDGSGGGDLGGGGGGGYGSAGTEGEDSGGAAGDETGKEYLVPLAKEGEFTGAGGGGGGAAAGGGSGGVIELTSPAIVSFGSGAIVSANGGQGVGGDVACTLSGNGGGGSGGAILVRAGAAILAAVDARIEALGGTGATGGSGCDGGDGGAGRIRIDGPGEELPSLEPADYHAGPAFAAPIPPITQESSLSVLLRGKTNTDYEVILNGGSSPTVISTDGSGTGEDDVSLEPGLNRLCVRVSPAADLTYPESKNCATVAYIPQ